MQSGYTLQRDKAYGKFLYDQVKYFFNMRFLITCTGIIEHIFGWNISSFILKSYRSFATEPKILFARGLKRKKASKQAVSLVSISYSKRYRMLLRRKKASKKVTGVDFVFEETYNVINNSNSNFLLMFTKDIDL